MEPDVHKELYTPPVSPLRHKYVSCGQWCSIAKLKAKLKNSQKTERQQIVTIFSVEETYKGQMLC